MDIEALRSEGLSGRVSCRSIDERAGNAHTSATSQEIIQKQVEEHAAFDLKTEYSKDKYMKRKEAKYV